MIVCSCHAVNDRALETILDNGASSVREVADACGAGTDCGQCCRDILAAVKRRRASVQPVQDDRVLLSK